MVNKAVPVGAGAQGGGEHQLQQRLFAEGVRDHFRSPAFFAEQAFQEVGGADGLTMVQGEAQVCHARLEVLLEALDGRRQRRGEALDDVLLHRVGHRRGGSLVAGAGILTERRPLVLRRLRFQIPHLVRQATLTHRTRLAGEITMSIDLTCVERGHKGEQWTLSLESDAVVAAGPDGSVMGRWTPQQAVDRFTFPGLSDKYFTIAWENGSLRFKVARQQLQQIKEFGNVTVSAEGVEAIDHLRSKAVRDVVIGSLSTLGGLAATFGTVYLAARSAGGGVYVVTYGLIAVGLTEPGRGITGLNRCRQLKKLSDEFF